MVGKLKGLQGRQGQRAESTQGILQCQLLLDKVTTSPDRKKLRKKIKEIKEKPDGNQSCRRIPSSNPPAARRTSLPSAAVTLPRALCPGTASPPPPEGPVPTQRCPNPQQPPPERASSALRSPHGRLTGRRPGASDRAGPAGGGQLR